MSKASFFSLEVSFHDKSVANQKQAFCTQGFLLIIDASPQFHVSDSWGNRRMRLKTAGGASFVSRSCAVLENFVWWFGGHRAMLHRKHPSGRARCLNLNLPVRQDANEIATATRLTNTSCRMTPWKSCRNGLSQFGSTWHLQKTSGSLFLELS